MSSSVPHPSTLTAEQLSKLLGKNVLSVTAPVDVSGGNSDSFISRWSFTIASENGGEPSTLHAVSKYYDTHKSKACKEPVVARNFRYLTEITADHNGWNEIQFFTSIAPLAKGTALRLPECYGVTHRDGEHTLTYDGYVATGEGTGFQGIVVMEDLMASGFELGRDFMSKGNLDSTVKTGLKYLANLHGAYWHHGKELLDLVPHHGPPQFATVMLLFSEGSLKLFNVDEIIEDARSRMGVDGIVDNFLATYEATPGEDKCPRSEVRRLATWAVQNAAEIRRRARAAVFTPRTLIHGDFGPHNMCFRAGDDEPIACAFDWQSYGVGCPAVDIVYFLANIINPDAMLEQGGASDSERLEYYHSLLPTDIQSSYPLSQLRNDYAVLIANVLLSFIADALRWDKDNTRLKNFIALLQFEGFASFVESWVTGLTLRTVITAIGQESLLASAVSL